MRNYRLIRVSSTSPASEPGGLPRHEDGGGQEDERPEREFHPGAPGHRFGGILAISLSAGPVAAWTPAALFAPCRGDCGVAVYGGPYVDDSLTDLVTDPQSPATWDYRNDFLLAAAISREAAQFGHLHLEPELGLGQRFGQQHETEVWAALFFLLPRPPARHDRAIGSAAAPKIRSLAVLPLVNMSGDPGQEYFADGMTEELITNLASIEALKVISRTSVMRYKGSNESLKDIAKALDRNVCRCGTYPRIVHAIKLAAARLKSSEGAPGLVRQ